MLLRHSGARAQASEPGITEKKSITPERNRAERLQKLLVELLAHPFHLENALEWVNGTR